MDTEKWKSVLVPKEIYDEIKKISTTEGRTISGTLRQVWSNRNQSSSVNSMIPIEIYAELKNKSVREGRTISDILRELWEQRNRSSGIDISPRMARKQSANIEKLNILTVSTNLKKFLVNNSYDGMAIDTFLAEITCADLTNTSDFSLFYGLELIRVLKKTNYNGKLERLELALKEYSKEISTPK